MKTTLILLTALLFAPLADAAEQSIKPVEAISADLLIVGADESGCAAAVQAARLGVKNIVLVNDIDWLGGQFSTQGIGPIDEVTQVNGKKADFPVSGAFQEIMERIHAHNRRTYGVARPGNSWCGNNTIEPKAAAQIFEDWLAPYRKQIRVLRGWEPKKVLTADGRVTGVVFHKPGEPELTVTATLTADSSTWGDVIRMSGAAYMAGPDLKSRFQEASAPEKLAPGGEQEMNPISWTPFLREAGEDRTIPRPERYDPRSFEDWRKAPPWVDWDGSGGIYNPAGWCFYTHRRMVDRHHLKLPAGTEAVILNWPAHDYPLSTLPKHVVDRLEKDEPGASKKNIVDMTSAQRRIIYEDAKQRSLEFLYWLQTAVHDRVGDFPQSFRYMTLADDYGTPDRLPPKPYIREGLRLEALYILREQDVRTEANTPLWAKVMVPDGILGYQFNMDFHPTRRKFVGDDPAQPWQTKHYGTRNWSAHTDRAMLPLRGMIPVKTDGLLGCSKNIGVTSMVQSSLRLQGQMMHVGTAVGTVAALALREGVQPRAIASSFRHVREAQRTLLRGSEGPGTLIWPWHDVRPEDPHFEAANMLAVTGIWRPEADSLFFGPHKAVTRRELAGAVARLCRSLPGAKEWPTVSNPLYGDVRADDPDRPFIEAMVSWGSFSPLGKNFTPDATATCATLHEWLRRLGFAPPRSLLLNGKQSLTRAECVDFLYRLLQEGGERLPEGGSWLRPGGDDDGDGRGDYDDPLPFDRDNNSVPDRLQPPLSSAQAKPFGRRVLVADFSGDKVAIVAADGTVEWQFPAEKPQDVWMLKNGNVLFSHLRGAREVTMNKEVAWEYVSPENTEVHSCQPLPDGGVLVAECGTKRLVEVGRDGRIAREIPVPIKQQSTHGQLRGCRRTPDGRYLISANASRTVLELGADGKLLREIKVPGDTMEVRELANRHLLVACGDGHDLIELDAGGKVVWRLGAEELPGNPLRFISGFQILPDGHLVVCNWLGHGHLGTTAQFFELDANRKVVRQFADHARFVSISKVQLLDVPGDPAKDEVRR